MNIGPYIKPRNDAKKNLDKPFQDEIAREARRLGLVPVELGEVDGKTVVGYKSTGGLKTRLLVGGVHGDEQAGPFAILSWMKETQPHHIQNISMMVIPIFNREGFNTADRESKNDADPNRNFVGKNGKQAPEVPIVKDNLQTFLHYGEGGVLSLHETKYDDAAFVYGYGMRERCVPYVEILSRFFDIKPDGDDGTGRMLVGGIHMDSRDGSLEDFLNREGVPFCLVTETPNTFPMMRRINALKAVIKHFFGS